MQRLYNCGCDQRTPNDDSAVDQVMDLVTSEAGKYPQRRQVVPRPEVHQLVRVGHLSPVKPKGVCGVPV